MAKTDMVLSAQELIAMGLDISVPFPEGTHPDLIPGLIQEHLGIGDVVWCIAPSIRCSTERLLEVHTLAISLPENQYFLRPGSGFLIDDYHIIYQSLYDRMDFLVDGSTYTFPRYQEDNSLDVIDFRVKRSFPNGYMIIEIFSAGSLIMNPVA